MNIAVYCASSEQAKRKYYEVAAAVGRLLAENGHRIYYGGACIGLMGSVADAALAAGGEVVGVIPTFMTNIERHHHGLTQSVKTETMQERKRVMFENTDMVITLAGSYGTLDELFEVLSLKRLGQFAGRALILNTDGFYDPLLAMVQRMVDEGFMQTADLEMLEVADDLPTLAALIAQS
jgi:uncharacterized protein (TIGR00730 family)